jgi:hypothetical protein
MFIFIYGCYQQPLPMEVIPMGDVQAPEGPPSFSPMGKMSVDLSLAFGQVFFQIHHIGFELSLRPFYLIEKSSYPYV